MPDITEHGKMTKRFILLVTLLTIAPICWGQGAERINRKQNPTTVIGPRNVPLHDGAEELLAGNNAEGVRLTHQGLNIAAGNREEEAALSNLCAGYIKLELYDNALKYCDLLLARNDQSWRGYNNRAVVYILTKQWEKAEADLKRGEAIRPGEKTLKVARAMYMDAVHPVAPEIEIDDRDRAEQEKQNDGQQP
jgi:tetratricopeptide (TPR) repeat protein